MTSLAGRHESVGANHRAVHNGLLHRRGSLAASGREDDAAPILRRAFEAHDGWIELLKRLPAAGLFPDDGELIARLIGTRAVSEPESAPPPAAF